MKAGRYFYPEDLLKIFEDSEMTATEVETAMAAIEAEISIDEPKLGSVVICDDNPEFVFSRTIAGWKQVGGTAISKWSDIVGTYATWTRLLPATT